MSLADSLRVDPARPDEASVTRVADALDRGGVVLLPSDTVYGLSVDAMSPDAVERLATIKGYRSPRPFVVLFDGSRKWLDRLTLGDNGGVREIAAAYWPGPLTLVVRSAPDVPPHLVSRHGAIALRVPRHALSLAVIAALGRPIVSTSANAAGEVPLSDVGEMQRLFADSISLIVDGGAPEAPVASTVVDVTGERPVVVRQGATLFEDRSARSE